MSISTELGKPIDIKWMTEELAQKLITDIPKVDPPGAAETAETAVVLLFGPGGVGPLVARMDELKEKADDEDLEVISSFTGVYFDDTGDDASARTLTTFALKLVKCLGTWCASF